MDDATMPGPAKVRYSGREWPVPKGRPLSFGRGGSCDIRFAHDPLDDLVSRTAGLLERVDGGLLVHNRSATQTLVLQPFPGPEEHLRPRAVQGTMPHQRLQLIIPGRHGSRYVLHLYPNTETHFTATPPPTPAEEAPTRPAASKITARERRMLAALCEPLLTLSGDEAKPATYRDIAQRVSGTAASARNCLDLLRLRLSEEDGIPGLRHNDIDERGPAADFRLSLATWALASGTVSRDDLGLLNPAPRNQ